MPDQKITDLTALTGANAATGDLVEVVDISDSTMAASGTNKKMTLANLAAAVAKEGVVAADAIFDAKGDLAAGTGANTAAKLTVGSNGTVLIADSGEATGLRWGQFGSVYGLGGDGDVTISTNTTLSAPMFYNNLTVDAGVTLTVAQYPIYVKGTLTLNGTISGDGNSTTTNVGGAQLSNNRLWLSAATAGVNGTAGTGTNGNNATQNALGGAGGNGGAGWTGINGGTGGTVTAPVGDLGGVNSPSLQLNWLNCQANSFGVTSGSRWATGASGGAGAGDASANGAGSGGGGGGVWIAARRLAGTGTISAKGGNGANGRGTNGGGGGGGGGGVVILITQATTNPLTVDVAGGTGGTGAGTGSNGSNGSAGRSYVFLGVM